MAKVCLDFGHGGSDSGAVNGTRYEKNDVLNLGLKVRDLLKKQNVEVICTRENDKSITINERTKLANEAGADYFLSIHRNSATASATGNEIWVYSKANDNTTNQAKGILDNVVKVASLPNRGVKKGAPSYTDFGVNRNTKMPSALLELGFISNASDNKAFDQYINEYAVAICKGVCSALGVAYKEPAKPQTPAPDTNTGTIYKVQVGAYRLKLNATSMQNKLKKAGFDTFVAKVDSLYKVQVGAFSVKANADAMLKKLKAAGFDGFITK